VKYKITRHAQDAMAKRGISIAWLEKALFSPQTREPDAIDPELEHRLVVIPEYGQRVLRVVVNMTGERERVVTAFFDRSMRGKL
jgi:uncharacterized DUF497 family protein